MASNEQRKSNNPYARTARKKVKRQTLLSQTRQKYGPSMRPAPVVIKSLDTGEIKDVIVPTTRAQREEIKRLRRELGIRTRRVPQMSNDADRMITWLRQRAK